MMPSKIKCRYCAKPFYPERLKASARGAATSGGGGCFCRSQ